MARKRRKTTVERNTVVVPLVPLRDMVVFPNLVTPLLIGRERSLAAIEAASVGDSKLFLAAQKSSLTETPGLDDIHKMGVYAHIIQSVRMPDGTMKVLVEAISRCLMRSGKIEPSVTMITGLLPPKDTKTTWRLTALMRSVSRRFEEWVQMSPTAPVGLAEAIAEISLPGQLADIIAAHLPIKTSEKQEILAALAPRKRLTMLAEILERELQIVEVQGTIENRIRDRVMKTQKDFYLREQLRAIEAELGAEDPDQDEYRALHEKIDAAGMPEAAEEVALKQLDRLSRMMPLSPQASIVSEYIEWLVSMPWSKATEDQLDLEEAARILDLQHYGLEEPKRRITEYLAVRQLTKKMKGPIICLVGPPGTGKTSLARSIAKAVGRKFVRKSLGGVRDEAEIRGHRRTYIGALPGRIIQSIAKAGSKNPVFLLDEVDKMGSDFRGDPCAALLEVLDPDENYSFSDHYLEVEFDLSEVFFITTANVEHDIPPVLRDRMEIIRLPGYTYHEKMQIARKFLLPRQRKFHGLKAKHIRVGAKTLDEIIRKYTREAGLRNLDRCIAQLCRRVAKMVVAGESDVVKVSPDDLVEYLGPAPFEDPPVESGTGRGVASGLAWTEAGGVVMNVEATTMPGKGRLTLTGLMGDVMQESVRAALSYARAHASELGIDAKLFAKNDIHVHVPEGAVPKDGPSAGVAMLVALVSAIGGRLVRRDIALTGEITLRGRILPVGGIKEKLLAAHRDGLRRVVIPKANEKNLRDIPDDVLNSLKVKFVENAEEVLEELLVDQR